MLIQLQCTLISGIGFLTLSEYTTSNNSTDVAEDGRAMLEFRNWNAAAQTEMTVGQCYRKPARGT